MFFLEEKLKKVSVSRTLLSKSTKK